MVFSRWAQVMFRFEKSMYENPDQDLNRRWWELVEKYQLLKMPAGRDEPDWAAKIHIALYPCYYHNYLLGELLASQLYYHIAGPVLKSPDPEERMLRRAPRGRPLPDRAGVQARHALALERDDRAGLRRKTDRQVLCPAIRGGESHITLTCASFEPILSAINSTKK